MNAEIIKLASELFQLLIDGTKDNSVQWINVDKLSDYNKGDFELVLKYVQKRLLNNLASCGENSYYVCTDNTLLVLLCFKNIISNELVYELISINKDGKLIVFSDYDEKKYSLRLGNLIKFHTISDGDDSREDVESIKAVVGEFQDSESFVTDAIEK